MFQIQQLFHQNLIWDNGSLSKVCCPDINEKANPGEILQLTIVTESIRINIMLKLLLYEKVFWGKKIGRSSCRENKHLCFLFSIQCFLKDCAKLLSDILLYIAILLNIGYIVNITPLLTIDLL